MKKEKSKSLEIIEEVTVEPVVEPVEDPIVEPVEDPIVEPVEDPIVEPVEDPIIEPVEDPIVEPVDETKDEETKDEETKDEESKDENIKGAKLVKCTKLNVRKEANKNAEVVYIINEKSVITVNVEESTEDFYKVYTSDKEVLIEGYCMKEFISIN